MMEDLNLSKQIPGVLGALSAVLFLKGSWWQRVGMVLPGCVLARYAGEPLAQMLHMNESLAGYLLGLFGMAMVGKVFETWQALELGTLLRRKVAAILGVSEGGTP